MKILKVFFFNFKLNKETYEENDFDFIFKNFHERLSEEGTISLEDVAALIKEGVFDKASE